MTAPSPARCMGCGAARRGAWRVWHVSQGALPDTLGYCDPCGAVYLRLWLECAPILPRAGYAPCGPAADVERARLVARAA